MNPPVFIHADLDDYGLSPAEFRVFCHVSRRAGGGNGAFSAVGKMATKCQLHEDTVRAALRALCRFNMLSREERRGETSVYKLTPQSSWRPPLNTHPSETKGGVSNPEGSPPKRREAHPSETKGDEVTPLEITKEVTPSLERDGEVLLQSRAGEIFSAYPKQNQTNRAKAILEIKSVLKEHDWAMVLEKTRKYAEAVNAWQASDLRWVKSPVTFFKEQEFLADPARWNRATALEPAWKRVKKLEKAFAEHQANPDYAGYLPERTTPEMRADFTELKAKLKEASDEIADQERARNGPSLAEKALSSRIRLCSQGY